MRLRTVSTQALLLSLLLFCVPASADSPCPAAPDVCAAAHRGDAAAEYALGEIYFTSGDDYPAAKQWYLKAAEQGHGLSALRLGFLDAEAHFKGLTPDYAEAEKWFLIAAEQDAGDAKFRLGNFYANYKEPRDYPRAFLWLKRAAEGGNRTAMFDLARLIREGKGTEKDGALALAWMTKAAEAGVPQAAVALTEMYAHGDGAPRDPALALKWTLRIANDPGASVFWLDRAGDMFFEGSEGAPKNYPTARKFYDRAAARGDRHALERLARIYSEGLGVAKDPLKAREYQDQARH